MEHSMFITFANQKGGVGKSTLCILFANYLASRQDFRETVAIYDCDPQRSIVRKRQAEEQDAIERAKSSSQKNSCLDTDSDVADTLLMDSKESVPENNEDVNFSDDTKNDNSETEMNTSIAATIDPKNPEEASLMVPYRIDGLDFDDSFFDNLKSIFSTKEVCLFDTPGAALSVHTKGLLQMTDYLICPLHLDRLSIAATLEYCSSILRYRENFLMKTKRNLKFRVIFITNAQDPQVGTKEEKMFFDKAKSMLMKMGLFVSDIKCSADIEQRVSTAGFVKSQKKTVEKTFNEIFDIIFNNGNNE